MKLYLGEETNYMRKREEVKDLIILKTKELIKDNPELTIKDIAEACYINIAAVNYHFGSKDNLISIVMNLIIDELKETVFNEMKKITEDDSIEDTLEKMLNIIYNFTMENTGVVRYLFLKKDNQINSTNLLIDAFFSDNEFTKTVFEYLSRSTEIQDKQIIYARYMLLFSSFSIPLFIEIAKKQNPDSNFSTIQDPSFRQAYINELLRLVR